MWLGFRGRARKVLLLVASVLVALLLGETGMRLVGWATDTDLRLYQVELTNPDRLPRGLLLPSRWLGARLQPNVQVLATTSDFSVLYKINSQGLRDGEHPFTRSPGTIRIVALGDSNLFGEGVPYGRRFVDIPEDVFDNLEIVDAGVPGFGLDQELLLLLAEGTRYHPDGVIVFLNWAQVRRWSSRLAIDEGRVRLPDPPADDGTAAPPEQGPQYVPEAQLRAMHRPFAWGLNRSYLLSWLRYLYQVRALRHRFEQADEQLWRTIRQDTRQSQRREQLTSAERNELYRRRARAILRKMQEVAADEGFRLAVVNIDLKRSLEILMPLPPGVTYHDLQPVLAEASTAQRLTFKIDPHLNAEGHRVIAEQLVEILSVEIPGLD